MFKNIFQKKSDIGSSGENIGTNAVGTKKSKFGNVKTWVFVIVALLLLGVVGVTYAKYTSLKEENARLSNPQEAAKVEADRLKAEVGSLIELPANESPTIATVVDASKLKNQAFFANAQNDDRVLMFPQAKKAILYRPSTKKIIEVAPINIGDDDAQNGGTTQGATTDNPTTPDTTKRGR